ncbi:AEC family transporter [Candidatus Sumerlaeota bacterium]|nr:AEC family transporter [Candidatus Sumerlaeota bacterium]
MHQAVLSGVGQTFLVAAVGLIGRLLGIINEQTLRHLTRITVALLLPCFLFEAVQRSFSWGEVSSYGLMILAAFGLLAVGLALAWVGAHALGLGARDRHTTMALCGFNNSVNIPVPLAMALLSTADADRMVVLFTIYNLVWGPLMWSLGVWLIAKNGDGETRRSVWGMLITPPGVAILIGVLAQCPGVIRVTTHPAMGTLHGALTWTGEAAIPMCLLILGGIIGGLLRRMSFHWRVVGLTAVVKLLAVPAIVWLTLRLGPSLEPLVALALMMQAASPPATNLAIIAEHWGGDIDTVGATILVTYLLSLAGFALWLGVLL